MINGIPIIEGAVPIPTSGVVEPMAQGFTEAGGYKIKWVDLRKGERVLQHVHPHAHITLVMSGTIALYIGDNLKGLFYEMEAIEVPAGAAHELLANTDARIACIHYLPEE